MRCTLLSLAALTLASLAACAHSPSHVPPAFGFHGRVKPHRDVVCLIDADMTLDMCEQVGQAVDKINAAVGFELLAPPRPVGMEFVKLVSPEAEVIVVAVAHLGAPTLGETRVQLYEQGEGWLRAEVVILDPGIWADVTCAPAVVLHELLHAVGGEHAPQHSPFDSVLKPAWQPGAAVELTAADISALRAAYSAD